MKLKIALLALFATVATVLTVLSQTAYPVASYSTLSVPLPVTSLAVSTGTNIAGGWTTTQYFTNTTIVYSQTSGGFVTNVVYFTNTASIFSSFYAGQQKDVGLQFSCQGATNVQLTFGRSVISGQPDTVNNFTWTYLAALGQTNANGYYIEATNIPASFNAGLGFLYLIGMTNLDSVHPMTNAVLNAAVEKSF